MFLLSKRDTNILKGVALLLLLLHHCFYTGAGFDDVVLHGHPLVKNIGVLGKLCVAIFVFLSGYGLMATSLRQGRLGSLWMFYRRRFAKLMVNYWLIWLLFVPVGIFVFNRTFPIVYGDGYIYKALWDFLGLHLAMTGSYWGYNPTWWFYSCIIMLYLLFPLVWCLRSLWPALIVLAFMFPTFASYVPIVARSGCCSYFMSFVCGAVMAYVGADIAMGGVKTRKILLLGMLLLFACLYRFVIDSLVWDAAIVVLVVMLYQLISLPSWLERALQFLGVHSYNIFLFHTFIFALYFHDFIFWSRNPILIYTTLLLVCIPVSMGIEWLKSAVHINKLQEVLAGKK